VLILAGLAFGLRAPLGAVLLSYVYLVLVAIGSRRCRTRSRCS